MVFNRAIATIYYCSGRGTVQADIVTNSSFLSRIHGVLQAETAKMRLIGLLRISLYHVAVQVCNYSGCAKQCQDKGAKSEDLGHMSDTQD